MALDRDFNSPGTQPLVKEKLSAPAAKCRQCGKPMHTMPVFLKNITCRHCYGHERYKRGEIGGAPNIASTLAAPLATPAVPDEPVAS